MAVLATTLAVALGGCSETPVAAEAMSPDHRVTFQVQEPPDGTGLVLESLTGVSVPLVGQVGEVVIDQVVITNLTLVEDVVGQIIGIEAEGILELTGGVLGTDVVTEEFATLVQITSTGPGQCEIITIDLEPIEVDVFGLATIDVPEATLTGRGSGLIGSLLCNLGSLLGDLIGGGGVIRGA